MKIVKSLFIYCLVTGLCGIISFLILGVIWYLISGVNNPVFLMAVLPFVGCWCIAGVIAWIILKTHTYLGFTTYIIAAILFGIICLGIMLIVDSSVTAWLISAIIGFFICSFPSYLLLRFFGVPLILKQKN